MKIAIYHNLPSGGAKRVVFDQVSRLAKQHSVDLFTLSSANQDFADVRPYVKQVINLPFQPLPLLRSPLGRLNQAVRLLDLYRLDHSMIQIASGIDAGGYDVVLVHPCQFSFSPTLLRYLHTPSLYYREDVVRWLHDPPILREYLPHSDWRTRLDRVDPLISLYKRALFKKDRQSMLAATRVVVSSAFVRESLYRLYGFAPYISILSIDSQRFYPLNLERENYVLSVGMINPYKGYDFLIDSLATIAKNHRPPLIVVGNMTDDQELAFLRQRAVRLGVQVEFRQMVTDTELLQLYNRAACFVYAPYMESFGLAPLEAMACGTPVVGIMEGGVRETVQDGVNGLLVERDAKAFGESILCLLGDPELRQRLGRQGRQIVLERWNWDNAIEQLESHLLEAGKRGNRKGVDKI